MRALSMTAESAIRASFEVVTFGQRCADWFVLRQFRVTGTNAGFVMTSSLIFRFALGLKSWENEGERTPEQRFGPFFSSWFSSKSPTEAMKRGTANENAVVCALRRLPFARDFFNVGMVAMKEARYLACSSDGIAPLKPEAFNEWEMGGEEVYITTSSDVVLAAVEIKTKVATSSPGRAVSMTSADVLSCDVGNETFQKYAPREHMAQVMHQLVVLRFRFAVYVVAAETGILYTVVIRCYQTMLRACENLIFTTGPIVRWMYEDSVSIPGFVAAERRPPSSSGHSFWRTIDDHVKGRGSFVPLQRFKHASQSFYSKTKAGVD